MSTDKKELRVSGPRLVAGKRKGDVVDIDLTDEQVRALIEGGHVRVVTRPAPEKKEK